MNTTPDKTQDNSLAQLAANIVSSFVAKNSVAAQDIPGLIKETMNALSQKSDDTTVKATNKAPAVPIGKSITANAIICLEDGKPFKSLKRHIRTHYNLSPEEYREKWGLPYDYPMVAPNYAKQRSDLAKRMGLGRGKGDEVETPDPPMTRDVDDEKFDQMAHLADQPEVRPEPIVVHRKKKVAANHKKKDNDNTEG